MDDLEALQGEVDAALLAWLRDPERPRLIAENGRPVVWGDGRPVALDVGLALHLLGGVRVASEET